MTEFNYRLSGRDEAHIFVGVRGGGCGRGRRRSPRRWSLRATPRVDLGGDDLAKTHVRHMVGGRAADAADEVLFSFEFPERPGALLQFLTGARQRAGTSRCSTTATTATRSGACCAVSRCRWPNAPRSRDSSTASASPTWTRRRTPPGGSSSDRRLDTFRGDPVRSGRAFGGPPGVRTPFSSTAGGRGTSTVRGGSGDAERPRQDALGGGGDVARRRWRDRRRPTRGRRAAGGTRVGCRSTSWRASRGCSTTRSRRGLRWRRRTGANAAARWEHRVRHLGALGDRTPGAIHRDGHALGHARQAG